MTDSSVTIRPPEPGDAALLIAGRDEESRRWLGEGDDNPTPTACVIVDGKVAGWVDYDVGRAWLRPDQVNIGYGLFPEYRGHGYATRAMALLLAHLTDETPYTEATFLIDSRNAASLGVAARLGATPRDVSGVPPGQLFFVLPVSGSPPP
jgi:RimJ/RimL family protein N-acetyltransferase